MDFSGDSGIFFSFYGQAGLELLTLLPPLSKCLGITGMYHHTQPVIFFLQPYVLQYKYNYVYK